MDLTRGNERSYTFQRILTIPAPTEYLAGELKDEFLGDLGSKASELGFTLGQDVFAHCSLIPQRGGEFNILAKVTLSATANLRKDASNELKIFLDEWLGNKGLEEE